MPLIRRKEYLHLAVEEANSRYIEEVSYYECGNSINTNVEDEVIKRINPIDKDQFYIELEENKDTYSHLFDCWENNKPLTPRAFYEIIVATGGEGLIVKPKDGKYLHKRGWEYSKIKKFLTRELIVLEFNEPTKEYTGKDIRKWGFWVEKDTDKRMQGNFYGDKKYIPVTRHYYYNQVGVMRLGVIITNEEYNAIPKDKRGEVYQMNEVLGAQYLDDSKCLMLVCECGGFDDETREFFTRNTNKMVGSVVEVKANELFRNSGKMRHPRYLRQRFDKEPERCTWSEHIGTSEVTK